MSKNKKTIWDIIVIGAGPSGMLAAITAAKLGRKVLILEQENKAGKKILATGNGKCNFTNEYLQEDCFRGDLSFVHTALNEFSKEQCLDFFHSIGIVPKSKNGYYYPNSEQAASVVFALTEELKKYEVDILCSKKVNDLWKNEKGFVLVTNENEFYAQKLIIATGLLASPKLGSNGSLFPCIKDLGHHFAPIVPALCGFYCKGLPFKKISGVRTSGSVCVMVDGKECSKDTGELQFTDYGISGIPVFQVSRYVSLALYYQNKIEICLDFLTDFSKEDLKREMDYRIHNHPSLALRFLFNGLLNQKLGEGILSTIFMNLDIPIKELSEEEKEKIITSIKLTKISVSKYRDFEFAQICAGGLTDQQVDSNSFESKLVSDLYFAGEILNVDGLCGGYNLHFAWASGFVAGKNAANKKGTYASN